MSLLLNAINCKQHCWQVCGNLSDSIFTGTIDRIYEVLLFFVLVGQLRTEKHYIVKDWPAREDFVPGRMLPW